MTRLDFDPSNCAPSEHSNTVTCEDPRPFHAIAFLENSDHLVTSYWRTPFRLLAVPCGSKVTPAPYKKAQVRSGSQVRAYAARAYRSLSSIAR